MFSTISKSKGLSILTEDDHIITPKQKSSSPTTITTHQPNNTRYNNTSNTIKPTKPSKDVSAPIPYHSHKGRLRHAPVMVAGSQASSYNGGVASSLLSDPAQPLYNSHSTSSSESSEDNHHVIPSYSPNAHSASVVSRFGTTYYQQQPSSSSNWTSSSSMMMVAGGGGQDLHHHNNRNSLNSVNSVNSTTAGVSAGGDDLDWENVEHPVREDLEGLERRSRSNTRVNRNVWREKKSNVVAEGPENRFHVCLSGKSSSIFTVLFVLHLESQEVKGTDSFKLDPTRDSFVSTRKVMTELDAIDQFNVDPEQMVSLEWVDMSHPHNRRRTNELQGYVFLLDVSLWKGNSGKPTTTQMSSLCEQINKQLDVLKTVIRNQYSKDRVDSIDRFEEPIVFICYFDEDLYSLKEDELSGYANTTTDHYDVEEWFEKQSPAALSIRQAIHELLQENLPIKLDHCRILIQDSEDYHELGHFIDHSFSYLATTILLNEYRKKAKLSVSPFGAMFGSSRDEEEDKILL